MGLIVITATNCIQIMLPQHYVPGKPFKSQARCITITVVMHHELQCGWPGTSSGKIRRQPHQGLHSTVPDTCDKHITQM